MHEIHFRVDDVLYSQLKDLSDASGRPFSKFLTSVLQEYVDTVYCYSQIKPSLDSLEETLRKVGVDLCQIESMERHL